MNYDITDLETRIDIAALKPTQDLVLVRAIDRERSGGGIFISGNPATECLMGEVIALGRGVMDAKTGRVFPFELEVGDHVLSMRYSGEKIEAKGEKYRLIRSSGIWARVEFSDRTSYELSALHPRFNSVLVLPREEARTRSGIWLPNEKRDEEARLATVVSVGPGRWNAETGLRDPCEVKAGDTVLITRYAGAAVRVGGKSLRLIQEEDIRCIVEGCDE